MLYLCLPSADTPPFSGALGFEQVIGMHSGTMLFILLLSLLLSATDHSPLFKQVAFFVPTSRCPLPQANSASPVY